MTTPTLYDVLGIDKSASAQEIRKGFKQRALETHPDKLLERGASEKEQKEASARFHKVREAFEILIDPQKRRSYDVRENIKPDYDNSVKYANMSERQKNMQKDREAWSRRMERQHQERMATLKEQTRLARLQKQKEAAEHQSMVDELLQELHRLNPEWEARRKTVQRVKEERARAAARSQGSRPIQTRSS